MTDTLEQKLWRFHTSSYDDRKGEEDIPENYTEGNLFVLAPWPWYKDVPTDHPHGTWACCAEGWVCDGMDGGPWGDHGTYDIFPATYAEITPDELTWQTILAQEGTIGKPSDCNWPPCVYMLRDVLNGYRKWLTEQERGPKP